MGHVALYRRFRPSDFDEIVEQKHAVSALRQAVISGNIAHAYLFSGTRGTGKTSIAKIFSRAVNCLSPRNGNPCNECEICRGILDGTLLDVIEMDAASNNSVDNIRRICDEVMFLPSRAKYKVYIIDEVHMLSGGAFNALLKTLEEPPAHAIFILATTEPHRIPATIISRCQRYDFRRIPTDSMVERLSDIAKAQNVSVEQDALLTIANLSDGALRDAISLLDQVTSGALTTITRDDVLKITGVVDDAFLSEMAEALLDDDAATMITLTDRLMMDGRDLLRFTLDLAHYFRDVLVLSLAPDKTQLVQATTASLARMRAISGKTDERTLSEVIARLSALISEMKWSPDMRTSFEISILSFGFSHTCDTGKAAAPAKKPSAPRVSVSAEVLAPPVLEPQNPIPPRPVPEPQISILSRPIPEPQSYISAEPTRQRSNVSVMPATDFMPPPPLEIPAGDLAPSDSPLPGQLNLFGDPPPAILDEEPAIPDLFSNSDDPGDTTGTRVDPADSLEPPSDRVMTPDRFSHTGTVALEELWSALLHRWSDSMFSDVLQLKNASVRREGRVFSVIFPDIAGPYVHSLTGRPEYKRIMKDVQMMIPDIDTVRFLTATEANAPDKGAGGDSKAPLLRPSMAKWVEEAISYSEAEGIPIETVDEL